MSAPSDVCFAQITDLHVGNDGLNPREAEANLRWVLEELAALPRCVLCLVVTADLVCCGKREELAEYRRLLDRPHLPVYALPANHDLWGEADACAWEELIGPRRQVVELGGLRIILWDDSERRPGQSSAWRAHASQEKLEWLAAELATEQPTIVAHHIPTLPIGDDFHDQWSGSNAAEVLDLFRERHVLATITGHWHRNGEWPARGVRVINTGALCGWQWTGTPPHYCFPTRPGYRLFHFDGTLRTLWREGSYWQTPAPGVQVALEWIGPAHTGGPRPQVHPVEVAGRCRLRATAYSTGEAVERVEWSLVHRDWRQMVRTYHGLWSEWEAELDPKECRAAGELICCVRCRTKGNQEAYDQVPVRIAPRDSSPKTDASARACAETLFEMHYAPE